MPKTITIVEDDLSFATLLKKSIEVNKDFICLAMFNTVQQVIENFQQAASDIVLLDIQLPDGSGLDLIASIKQELPDTHIIMCTSFEDDEKIFSALKAGASGYIVKTDLPDNIIDVINEAINGGAPMSSGVAKKVINYFHNQQAEIKKLEQLTLQENTIMLNLSKGFLYKEIAHQLNIGIDTVKKHCGNIYRKLHVSNKTEAINLFMNRNL